VMFHRVRMIVGGVVIALAIVTIGAIATRVPARDPSALTLVPVGPLPSDPDVADRAVIEQLRLSGANLARPTEIVHYLYIPSRRDALVAAIVLQRRGFDADVREPLGKLSDGTSSNDYGVIAKTHVVPSLQNLRKTRPLFDGLAKRYGGTYDGWEAAVTK
jgi:Regulator of ribonuclease activity B